MLLLCVFVAVATVATAAPKNAPFGWVDIEEANKVDSTLRFQSQVPFEQQWQDFKTMHSKFMVVDSSVSQCIIQLI